MVNRSTTSATSLRAAADLGTAASRRGLTLLEILVVISILLAAGAIVVPFTLRELERRQAVLLEDRLSMLIQFARVESRRSGVPVEVLIDADGRRVEARRLDVARLDEGGISASDALDAMPVGEAPGDADDSDRFVSAWARHELEDGRLVPPATEAEAGFDVADAFATLEFESGDDDASRFDTDEDPWSGRVRLALFFPDGTSVTTTPAVLETSRGDRRWSIDPWSGRSTFEVDVVTATDEVTPFDDVDETMDDAEGLDDSGSPDSDGDVDAGVRP